MQPPRTTGSDILEPVPLPDGTLETERDQGVESYILGQPRICLRLAGQVTVSVPESIGPKPLRCRLEVGRLATSDCIWAIASERRRTDFLASGADQSPRSTLHSAVHGVAPDTNGADAMIQARIFCHCLDSMASTFPHVLHPRVEGGRDRFTVTFRRPQTVIDETKAELSFQSFGLKYTFSSKTDRDLLQSKIFGKPLLGGAGVSKIYFKGTGIACEQQALRVWQDPHNDTKTMVFFQNMMNSKRHPSGYVEYTILGLEDAKEANKPGDTLDLKVLFNTSEEFQESMLSQRSSRTTSRSSISNVSTASARTGTTKAANCIITFTEPRGKKDVLRLLQ